jgi:hypothetical protein
MHADMQHAASQTTVLQTSSRTIPYADVQQRTTLDICTTGKLSATEIVLDLTPDSYMLCRKKLVLLLH